MAWITRTSRVMTLFMLVFLCLSAPAFAGTSIPFTINLSKAVNVTGTPRIAVDVGGVTRYANYTSGSGTSALTFTYAMVAGDVDLDGVTVSSPIDLNGGTIKDLVGNDLSPLTFTPPNTTNVKVNYPSLGMDFAADADGRYTLNGTAYNDLSSFLTATGGTFTRASVGTYYDVAGTLQTATANTPRFDYDPVTHTPKGILIEESRTNLLTRSSEFENAYWLKNQVSITANSAFSPDGSNTADKIINNTTTGEHSVALPINTLLTTPYTASYSVYLKAGEYNYAAVSISNSIDAVARVFVNLTNGSVTQTTASNYDWNFLSNKVVPVGNNWYRVTVSVTKNTSTGGTGTLEVFPLPTGTTTGSTGDNTSGIYVWGAQLEQGSFPTSYIPTTTAAVIRAADVLTVPTGSWFTGSQGTLLTNFKGYAISPTYRQLMNIGDSGGGITERVSLSFNSSSAARAEVGAAGTLSTNTLQTSAGTEGANNKFALSYNNSPTSIVANGGTVANGYGTGSGTFVAPSPNVLDIGNRRGSLLLNGWISNIKYYPARTTNTQLQLLTQ